MEQSLEVHVKIKSLQRRRRMAHRCATRARKRARTAAPTEIEIKLEVPETARAGLAAAMAGPDSHELQLQATYYDTASGELARAGIALRVRRERGCWVQTLKAPGSDAIGRLEENVVIRSLPGDAAAPLARLDRHQHPSAQRVLRQALGLRKGDRMPETQPVFQVNVTRRVRRVVEGGSTIEVALDDGQLVAQGRKRPIHELELELLEGDVRDLVALASRWRSRWGLWFNTASKAARGHRLASGELHGPAVTADRPQLRDKPDLGSFSAAALDACLRQVMGNASEIAAGSRAEGHVHQLRVGLRRLRTALRALPDLEDISRRIEPALVEVFRLLGELRDRSYVLHKIQPLVEAAGGAPLRVPPGFHEGIDPGERVRSARFQDAVLELLARADSLRQAGGPPARKLLRRRIGKLHEQVLRDGRRFTRLPPERQHRVRKRLKRLRYLSEFAQGVFGKKTEDYLEAIKPMQDVLGQYNDEIMAQHMYQELVGGEPGARFGVEWLRARQKSEAKACRKALAKLKSVRPFWEK